MALRTLSAKAAAALDAHLMSTGAFTIDQLMELAGLSVSECLYTLHPPSSGPRIAVLCGPGNNGGDGLVAARHLHHFGYAPTVYLPKQGKAEIYARLVRQLKDLSVPIRTEVPSSILAELDNADFVVDSVFGFSFNGEVREPFGEVIAALRETMTGVLAVDAPSSWNIESGPPGEGPGRGFQPGALISLTAPKPLVKWFKGRHFVGGRFLSKELADGFEIDVPPYKGCDQVVEVTVQEQKL